MTTEQFISIFKKIETPLAINVGFVGILLFLHTFKLIAINDTWLQFLYIYASLNLVSAPFAIKNRFITPNIVTPKCPFCGSYMMSVKLRCLKCNSTSEELLKE